MAPLETKLIFQAPIFHFHDYGRKGRKGIIEGFCFGRHPGEADHVEKEWLKFGASPKILGRLHSLRLTASLPLKTGQGPEKETRLVFQGNPFSGANLLLVSGRDSYVS